jgi:hypothetical protein
MNSGNEKILADYLQRHEGDIAAGIDDFADLRGIFIEVFNRKPDAKIEDQTVPGFAASALFRGFK